MERSKAVKVLIMLAWLAVPVIVGLVTFAVGVVLRETQGTAWTWAAIAFVIALVVLLLVWLGIFLYRKSKADQLEKTLGEGTGGGRLDQKGEIEALRKRWKESVSMLKSAGGQSGIAGFPWFAIIGAPASGKSTLLRQSEIDFPVGDAAVKGLHGTRNCDWWFSNVGIFLDTAGRYMSDSSAKEWGTFLDLLRRLRSGAPLNGVLIALPVPDLLTKSADDLDADARRIRARLDELIDGLGINFPVWIVLTKVDLIAGFAEFFGQADARTRRQIMGWTTEMSEGLRFDRGQFDARFDVLMERLRAIRPSMIGLTDLRDRPAAYHFPEEFATLQTPLGDFIQRIFEQNIYQETPYYRGVYVSSATQQGTPLQRAAAEVRSLLGVAAAAPDPHQSAISHSYFLRDLVNERVVNDRGLVWTTATEIGRGRLVRLGKNLTGIAVGLLLFMTVLAFGMRAGKELDAIEVPDQAASVVAACDGLWVAAKRASDSNYRNLGLSQQKSLKEDLGKKQEELFREQVLPPLIDRMEGDLRAVSPDDGIGAIADAWSRFELLRTALVRASEPMASAAAGPDDAPEDGDGGGDGGGGDDGDGGGKPEDGDGDGDGADEGDDGDAADAGIDSAPRGFFTQAEVDALVAMRAGLEEDGIVAGGGRDGGRRDLPDRLLDAIWRNGTGSATERLAGARAVLVEKCAEWLSRADMQAQAFDTYRAQQRDRVDEWRSDFETRCRKALDTLRNPDVESIDIVNEVLLPLLERAERPPEAGGGVPSELPYDSEFLSGVEGEIARLETVLTAEELASVGSFASVKAWLAPRKEEEAAAAADVGQRHMDALGALSKSLASLRDQVRKDALVPDPWPTRANVLSDAVSFIREEVRENDARWRGATVPHLMVLAGADDADAYGKDPDRWGKSIEVLDASLRRNALLRAFLNMTGKGGYRVLANDLVIQRREDARGGTGARAFFDNARMGSDLAALALPTQTAFDRKIWPRVSKSVRQLARDALEEQFRKLLTFGLEHWDRQCQDLPGYGGTPFDFLRAWTKPRGPVDLVARKITKNFEDPWSAPTEIAGNEAAEKVWELTADFRTRYAFFWTQLPALQDNLRKLLAHEKVTLEPRRSRGDLEALTAELARGAAPAVWAPGSSYAEVREEVLSTEHRGSLTRAVRDAERDLLRRLERYYSTYWLDLRNDIVAKIQSPSVANVKEARKQYDDFRSDLALLFTDSLGEDRGPGLTVTAAFRTTDKALRSYFDVQRSLAAGFSVTFTQVKLPSKFGGVQKTPYMQLAYKAAGRDEDVSDRMEPNGNGEFTVAWDPASAEYFEIRMVGDDDKDKLTFKAWRKSRCILQALRDGNENVGAQELTWTGAKRFGDATAKLSASYSDPDLLIAANSWLDNPAVENPAEGCVDLARDE